MFAWGILPMLPMFLKCHCLDNFGIWHSTFHHIWTPRSGGFYGRELWQSGFILQCRNGLISSLFSPSSGQGRSHACSLISPESPPVHLPIAEQTFTTAASFPWAWCLTFKGFVGCTASPHQLLPTGRSGKSLPIKTYRGEHFHFKEAHVYQGEGNEWKKKEIMAVKKKKKCGFPSSRWMNYRILRILPTHSPTPDKAEV